MIIKVKVDNISIYKDVDWVDIVDPIDSLDGGNKIYEGIIKDIDINNSIIKISVLNCERIFLSNILICPKKYEKAILIED